MPKEEQSDPVKHTDAASSVSPVWGGGGDIFTLRRLEKSQKAPHNTSHEEISAPHICNAVTDKLLRRMSCAKNILKHMCHTRAARLSSPVKCALILPSTAVLFKKISEM